jgi:chemotaxis protein MotA
MKFSIGTFLGFSICTALIILGIMDTAGAIRLEHYIPNMMKNPFIHIAGFFIVFGGVMASMFVMYPVNVVFGALGKFGQLFSQTKHKAISINEDVEMVVGWADRIKKDKKEFLNDIAQNEKDSFVRLLFDLYNTNYSSSDIRTMGETSIDKDYSQSIQMSDVFYAMANSAPAFGMLGTVLGMIVMLNNLNDPSNIGPGISTGLIGTLYGVASANLFFIPLSKKIRYNGLHTQRREIIILEGMLLIKENKPSMVIRDQLMSFVSRDDSDASTKTATAK